MKNKNLFLDKNQFYSIDLIAKNQDGTIHILTNKTLEFVVAKHTQSLTRYTYQPTIINASSGQFRITLTSEQTNQLPSGNLLYSIFSVENTNERSLLFIGTLTVENTIH